MQIVVGHANPDFDAYASTIAAVKLFPGSQGVFLGSQNENVRAFHNLHEEFFRFADLKGLDFAAIDSVVLVDTRDPNRVAELADVVRRPGTQVVIYDHHPHQEGDFAGADDRSRPTGATTSILVHEIIRRGLDVTPLEASVMLLGIHEDTGSLTYPGTTAYDAQAAAWLMENGADIEVLNQYLQRSLSSEQREILDRLISSLQVWDINGTPVAVGSAEAAEYVDSAGVLTHFVVEDMGFRAAIAVVSMPQRLQILARSRVAEVNVGAVMARLGGGGHPQAASAGFRDLSIPDALARLRTALDAEVAPPLVACDVMSAPVRSVQSTVTMRAAGELMARWGHGGLPVIDGDEVLGIITRKDVDKAIGHGLGHAPVKGFVTGTVDSVTPQTKLAELEALLARRGAGRIPVFDTGRLVGIVTRKDVLRAEHGDSYFGGRRASGERQAAERFSANAQRLLPTRAHEVLSTLGDIAAENEMRAYVVGGFVRDMLLGRPNLDIDVVIEGDGVAFAAKVAESLGVPLKVHRRFGTAVIVFDHEFHVDVASSRSEYYTQPGALPTVERSSFRQDLQRRDFAINAIAVPLDRGGFGALVDPFGGLEDLDGGIVRVLHPLSFVDDPTRVIRAVRFEGRFGFRMDESTLAFAREVVAMGLLGEVSGARVREELYDILAEDNCIEVLRRLEELGVLRELLPRSSYEASRISRSADALEALKHLGPLFERPSVTSAVLIAALTWGSDRAPLEHWTQHLRIRAELSTGAVTLAERGSQALRALEDRRGMRDSRLSHLLEPFPPAAITLLWAVGSAAARKRVERYLGHVRTIRPAVDGDDLIRWGAAPSTAFSAILARARDDRLDGRAVGRQAELANLRRIALHAGILRP